MVWLREQIAARRSRAEACIAEVGSDYAGDEYADGSGTADRDDFPSYPWGIGTAELAYMADVSPRDTLAQCVAHTRTLDLHDRMSIRPGHPMFNDAHLTTESMVICRSCEPEKMFRRTHSWPCRTVKAVALAYQHNPGYQERWRA